MVTFKMWTEIILFHVKLPLLIPTSEAILGHAVYNNIIYITV